MTAVSSLDSERPLTSSCLGSENVLYQKNAVHKVSVDLIKH